MTLSIERRAARWGDRTALIDVSETRRDAPAATVDPDRYSYADLAEMAERTSERLAAVGVGPGDAVCVLTRNRVESIGLFFACRRLGAVYAPLSHRLTPATAGRPVERIDPAVVVHEPAQRDLARELPPDEEFTFAELERVDPDEATDPGNRDESAGSDRPLAALHDDESGIPVVRFSATAVERNCIAVATTWGFGRGDRTFSFVPLSTYDGLLRAALPTLYAGGTVLFDRAFDPGDAIATLRRDRPTVLVGRMGEFRDLAARDPTDALASVEIAVCEGKAPAPTRGALREAEVALVRAYGRIECPTALAQSPEDVIDDAGDREGVGRPILDCEARLTADGSALEGAGEGRLQLSGPTLASGYLDSREAGADDREDAGTTERGEGDDRAGADDDRGRFADGWFDTGERARRREDGTYELA